jgi:hypothetical protein
MTVTQTPEPVCGLQPQRMPPSERIALSPLADGDPVHGVTTPPVASLTSPTVATAAQSPSKAMLGAVAIGTEADVDGRLGRGAGCEEPRSPTDAAAHPAVESTSSAEAARRMSFDILVNVSTPGVAGPRDEVTVPHPRHLNSGGS